MKNYCGECPLFKYECTDGWGWCDVRERNAHCGDECGVRRETIKPNQAVKILHYAQKWRRGAKIKQISSYLFGVGIDGAIRELRKKK